MPRMRLIITLVLALNGLAMTSSTAAHATPQWYINGAAFTGTETIDATATGSTTLLIGFEGGARVVVQCSKATTTGSIKDNDEGTNASVRFTECKVAEPSDCGISSTIETTELTSELEEHEGRAFERYAPKEGTALVYLEFTGCGLGGTYSVLGNARCEVEKQGSESASKKCDFTSESGSNLHFSVGITTVSLEGAFSAALAGTHSGDPWGVREYLPARWRISGSPFVGTEDVQVESTGLTQLSGSLTGGTKLVVQCEKAKTTGTVEESVLDASGPLDLSECKVREPSKCSVGAPLETTKLKSRLEASEDGAYDRLEAREGSALLIPEIVGCAGEGEYTLKGSLRCEFEEPASELAYHDCNFSDGSGSSLLLGAHTATLEGSFRVELTGTRSDDYWDLLEGAPVLEISPATVIFRPGVTTRELTLTNSGSSELLFEDGKWGAPGVITTNGANFTLHEVAGSLCKATLPVGKSCTVSVTSAKEGETGTYTLEWGNGAEIKVTTVPLES